MVSTNANNCHIYSFDLQVDLEPQGKIHLLVELKWHGKLSSLLTNNQSIILVKRNY